MANRMTEVTENDNVTSNDRILKESDRINKIKKWSIRISVVAAILFLWGRDFSKIFTWSKIENDVLGQ